MKAQIEAELLWLCPKCKACIELDKDEQSMTSFTDTCMTCGTPMQFTISFESVKEREEEE